MCKLRTNIQRSLKVCLSFELSSITKFLGGFEHSCQSRQPFCIEYRMALKAVVISEMPRLNDFEG
jgi:hypothetical protein